MVDAVPSMPNAVYRAEAAVLRPVARQFPTMQSITDFVEEVVNSDWWTATFPNAPVYVIVEPRSGSARWACAVGAKIAIPNNQHFRNMKTVLHELAHVATLAADGHGPIFRSAMTKLVNRYMGFYAATELERKYREELTI